MTNEMSFTEDPLIQGLLAASGKRVEAFAFGIAYVGKLEKVDMENGSITITEGEDSVMLELERIENFNVVEE